VVIEAFEVRLVPIAAVGLAPALGDLGQLEQRAEVLLLGQAHRAARLGRRHLDALAGKGLLESGRGRKTTVIDGRAGPVEDDQLDAFPLVGPHGNGSPSVRNPRPARSGVDGSYKRHARPPGLPRAASRSGWKRRGACFVWQNGSPRWAAL